MLAAAARNRELKFENWCLNFWRKVSGSAQFVDCTLNLSHFLYQATSKKTCKNFQQSSLSSNLVQKKLTSSFGQSNTSSWNSAHECVQSTLKIVSVLTNRSGKFQSWSWANIKSSGTHKHCRILRQLSDLFLCLILQPARYNILLCKFFTSLVQSQNPKHPMIQWYNHKTHNNPNQET